MRILFITEKFPYPLDSGGNIRTFNIIKGLSQAHEITLLSSYFGELNQEYMSRLKTICRETICIPVRSENRISLSLKILKSLLCSSPIVVERHYSPEVRKQIQNLFGNGASRGGGAKSSWSGRYDVVHFNHLDATCYLPWIPKDIVKVLDEHNIVINQIKTTLGSEQNGFKRLYMSYELNKTLAYESKISQEMHRCFVCSEVDKSYLMQIAGKARVMTIPNGVDVDYFSAPIARNAADDNNSKNNRMAFVGSLDYKPCDIGVRFFCKEIFPRIQSEVPDAEFVAIGRNPSRELQDLAKTTKNIHLTGWVSDVRPHVKGSKLFVVPLLSGSGTRLKILDAMAMGIPVLSTSIGAEGLEIRNNHDIVLRDTAEEFASSAVQLLRDGERRQLIASAGNRLVRKMYSWETIRKDLLREYGRFEKSTSKVTG
jgi:polysaccharide biosynthesis protein PslH